MILASVCGAVGAHYAGFAGFVAGVIAGSFIFGYLLALFYRSLKIPAIVIALGAVIIGEVLTYRTGELMGRNDYNNNPGRNFPSICLPV